MRDSDAIINAFFRPYNAIDVALVDQSSQLGILRFYFDCQLQIAVSFIFGLENFIVRGDFYLPEDFVLVALAHFFLGELERKKLLHSCIFAGVSCFRLFLIEIKTNKASNKKTVKSSIKTCMIILAV